jgi:hypothetical protein
MISSFACYWGTWKTIDKCVELFLLFVHIKRTNFVLCIICGHFVAIQELRPRELSLAKGNATIHATLLRHNAPWMLLFYKRKNGRHTCIALIHTCMHAFLLQRMSPRHECILAEAYKRQTANQFTGSNANWLDSRWHPRWHHHSNSPDDNLNQPEMTRQQL